MEPAQAIMFVFLILLAGSMIQGMSGFGFGLFCVGLLSFILPLQSVTSLVFALTTLLSGGILLKLWRYVVWRELIFILTGGLMGRLGGFWFLHAYGEEPWMRKLLGVVMLGMVLYAFFSKRFKFTMGAKLSDRALALLLGSVGGFVSGVFASGGPFFVIYFLLHCEAKNKYHAHLQMAFVVTNIFSVILQGSSGVWDQTIFIYLTTGIVAVTLGTIIGLRWFAKFPKLLVSQVTYSIICIVGIRLIFS